MAFSRNTNRSMRWRARLKLEDFDLKNLFNFRARIIDHRRRVVRAALNC